MHIVHDWPPLIDKIDAALNCRRHKGVIFTWGTTLFVPDRTVTVSDALIEHERVHAKRQELFVDDDGERGISAWWMRYIRDPAFRLAEEIPAHQAEYAYWHRQPDANRPYREWRHRRNYHLHFIARRLAGSLYGGLISMTEAKKVIADGCR